VQRVRLSTRSQMRLSRKINSLNSYRTSLFCSVLGFLFDTKSGCWGSIVKDVLTCSTDSKAVPI